MKRNDTTKRIHRASKRHAISHVSEITTAIITNRTFRCSHKIINSKENIIRELQSYHFKSSKVSLYVRNKTESNEQTHRRIDTFSAHISQRLNLKTNKWQMLFKFIYWKWVQFVCFIDFVYLILFSLSSHFSTLCTLSYCSVARSLIALWRQYLSVLTAENVERRDVDKHKQILCDGNKVSLWWSYYHSEMQYLSHGCFFNFLGIDWRDAGAAGTKLVYVLTNIGRFYLLSSLFWFTLGIRSCGFYHWWNYRTIGEKTMWIVKCNRLKSA